MTPGLRVETRGAARVITIDRPERRNAIDRELAARLGVAIEQASDDPAVRGVVLSSVGPHTFLSGGDLRDFAGLVGAADGARQVRQMASGLAAIDRADVPVVAAVDGDVYGGGCELLLLCDQVILEEHATLSFRHVSMGLVPAWGGVSRLILRAGLERASAWLLQGHPIPAAAAREGGLASEVVPRGAALARALQIVEGLAPLSREAVAQMKRAVRATTSALVAAALPVEAKAFDAAWGSGAHRAALDVLAQRKKP